MKNRASGAELYDVLTKNVSNAEIRTAMVISDIALAILKERVNRNMTQKEFADFVGVTQGMVSKWESGDYNFTVSSIANVFEKLEMNFEFSISQKTINFLNNINTYEIVDNTKISLKTAKNPNFRICDNEAS